VAAVVNLFLCGDAADGFSARLGRFAVGLIHVPESAAGAEAHSAAPAP